MPVELVRAATLTDAVPYAYAARAHGFLFAAGACPLDAAGDVVAGGYQAQAGQTMDKLESALAVGGAQLVEVEAVAALAAVDPA